MENSTPNSDPIKYYLFSRGAYVIGNPNLITYDDIYLLRQVLQYIPDYSWPRAPLPITVRRWSKSYKA